jgi:protocatechuate 4,5-dioxygenase alpha chain
MSLNKADNRDEFRQDEAAYLNKLKLSDEQKKAVLERDWLGMLQLGGNIYYTFKLAIFDGRSMQFVGGAMSDVSEEEFRQMMVSGGRPVEGNRSKKEQEQSNG